MDKNKRLVKFFVKGGLLAPTDLAKIAEVHDKLGGDHIQFTDRQEILIRVNENKTHLVASLASSLKFEISSIGGLFKLNNVVSSLVSKKIDESTYWVKQSSYLEILDNVIEAYTLKFNLTDLKQDFVYSFTGDVNFVASDEVNYWFLYLRNSLSGDQFLVPYMIYSEDVVAVMDFLEEHFSPIDPDFSEISEDILAKFGLRTMPVSVEPQVNVAQFNNYEGIHKYDEKYWLGIFMRDQRFSSFLLQSVAELCKAQMMGLIYVTPWKSLIIKEILSENLIDWKLFLASNQINNGHSEAELHWQINNFDEEAFQIKTFLRSEFSKKDMNINGAIFGVNIDQEYSFAHILIQKVPVLKYMGRNEMSTYKVKYRDDFNPINAKFVTYKKLVLRSNLSKVIKEIMSMYHDKAYKEVANFIPRQIEKIEPLKDSVQEKNELYRCKSCFTIYYPEYGDENLEVGVPFDELSSSYCCSVCGESKSNFEMVNTAIFSSVK